jgi:hypothetical protein
MPTIEQQLKTAEARFPMGRSVKYFPIAGEAAFHFASIRSEPWALGHGAIVIKITGRAGGVSVDHLEVV